MILVDAHVHIYDCFNLETFFNSAYRNFKNEAERSCHGDDFSAILLLADTPRENWFHRLSEFADGKSLPGQRETGGWTFSRTGESCSLHGRSEGKGELFVVAGSQVVTLEGLEVLSLSTTCSFPQGLPVGECIKGVREAGGTPVVPWGFGKWMGRRGAILARLLQTSQSGDFFLGDSGNRPSFFPYPAQFKLARQRSIRNLPGSDPLPLRSGERKPGSFGFAIPDRLDPSEPAKHLRRMIDNGKTERRAYGDPIGFAGFVGSQVLLQLRGMYGTRRVRPNS